MEILLRESKGIYYDSARRGRGVVTRQSRESFGEGGSRFDAEARRHREKRREDSLKKIECPQEWGHGSLKGYSTIEVW
jgi:hypothetical protein